MSAYQVLIAVGVIAFAYLLGSLNFAVIMSRIFTGEDVRKSGSGNTGATNVLRTAGKLPAILTFLLDILKGFVACLAGKLVFGYLINNVEQGFNWLFHPDYGAYICCIAVMLGHIYPIFFGFKGGKAVATSVGTFAVCCPLAIILGLTAFVISLIISKIVSLSSLIATVVVVGVAIVYAIVANLSYYNIIPVIIMALIAGVIVFTKHTANIKRLIEGTEPTISAKKR